MPLVGREAGVVCMEVVGADGCVMRRCTRAPKPRHGQAWAQCMRMRMRACACVHACREAVIWHCVRKSSDLHGQACGPNAHQAARMHAMRHANACMHVSNAGPLILVLFQQVYEDSAPSFIAGTAAPMSQQFAHMSHRMCAPVDSNRVGAPPSLLNYNRQYININRHPITLRMSE